MLLATVMGVFAALAYRVASRAALDSASARLEMVTAQFASLLGGEVDGTLRMLRASATDSTLVAFASGNPAAEAGALAFLRSLARDTSPGAAAELRDAAGRARLTARPETPLDSALAAEAPARPDSAAVGPFYLHDGGIYYEFGTPIRSAAGDPLHLVVRRRLGGPQGGMKELVGVIGTDAALLLGNRDGTLWGELGSDLDGPASGAASDGVYQRAGTTRLGSRVELAGTPWALGAEFPRAAVVRGAQALARDVGLGALLVLSLGTGLGWALSRRLTLPLTRLTAQAESLAGGGTPAALPGEGDEIGRLSAAFHTMVNRVEDGQERLRTSAAQYRLLFDLNPNPMWVFDRETLAFLAVNEAAVEKYGYTRNEFLGMTLLDIRPAEDGPAVMESVRSGADVHGTSAWRHVTREGKLLDVEITGRPLEFAGRAAQLVLAHDVTERRALEAQLRQSQKMEAVGRLAGGVAHDFNNILTVIQTASEFLLADLGPDDRRRGDAIDISNAAQRATALTRQLLAFGRQQVLELRLLDLNEVVRPLEPMLRRVVEANVHVVTHLAPGLGAIEADTTQIEQVILNLVLNARDAITGNGTILIETANVVLDDTYPRSLLVAPPGPYVVLTVTDTGCGMDAATRARIFEPFYTTKEIGHGTGLGLATVYGIVKQLGGQIWVYSEVGQGTTFKLYFRRHEGAGSSPEPAPPRAPRRETVGARILLVEDDVPVRTAVRRVLERHGYAVVEVETGGEVAAILAEPAHGVDLVISDMVMPGMTGIELRRAVHAIDARIPVLMMSGYSHEAITRLASREVLGPMIEKPFTVDGLLQKIEDVLGGAPSAAVPRRAPQSP